MQDNAAHIMQSGNLYAYCINNPIRWIDSSGLSIQPFQHEICTGSGGGAHDWNMHPTEWAAMRNQMLQDHHQRELERMGGAGSVRIPDAFERRDALLDVIVEGNNIFARIGATALYLVNMPFVVYDALVATMTDVAIWSAGTWCDGTGTFRISQFDYQMAHIFGNMMGGYLFFNVAASGVQGIGQIQQGASVGKNIVGTNFNAVRPTQDWINMSQVNSYVAKLKAGQTVRPIDVVHVQGRGFYIIDGHHRFVASQMTGIPINANVTTGAGPIGLPDWSSVVPR